MKTAPKLDLWHCLCLYALTPMGLKKVAEQAGQDIELLVKTAQAESWKAKKEIYLSWSSEKQQNVEFIELLLNAPTGDRRVFIQQVLDKVKASQSQKREQAELQAKKQQHVERLREFGIDPKQAESLLNDVINDLTGVGGDFAVEAELSPQQKIDQLNSDYSFFVKHFDQSLVKCHEKLTAALDFYGRMVEDMAKQYPSNPSFDELVQWQRPASYTAQAIAKLVSEYARVTGADVYTNHHAAVAKMFSKGYYVVPREQLSKVQQK